VEGNRGRLLERSSGGKSLHGRIVRDEERRLEKRERSAYGNVRKGWRRALDLTNDRTRKTPEGFGGKKKNELVGAEGGRKWKGLDGRKLAIGIPSKSPKEGIRRRSWKGGVQGRKKAEKKIA